MRHSWPDVGVTHLPDLPVVRRDDVYDKPAARGCAIQNWALLTIDLCIHSLAVFQVPVGEEGFRTCASVIGFTVDVYERWRKYHLDWRLDL